MQIKANICLLNKIIVYFKKKLTRMILSTITLNFKEITQITHQPNLLLVADIFYI